MEKTYFIRHSGQLDVDDHTIDLLWNGDFIGLHFPQDNVAPFEDGDSKSLDPNDYKDTARHSLERFHTLAREGGYVFAAYRDKEGAKLGYVAPDSTVELLRGKWGQLDEFEGRDAILKVLKLSSTKQLTALQSISFKAVQPQQGTFCQWHKIGRRVEATFNGERPSTLNDLTPDLQEVMCMEYLRTDLAKRHGLPKLQTTILPVGRTLLDLDIFGLAEDGQTISAQVTFHKLGDADEKLHRLKPYAGTGNHAVYFCNCADSCEVEGVKVFPISTVFDEFCKGSKDGIRWFEVAVGDNTSF
ncbi:hypothetical protein [Motiliproteus sediminis]|uniref:hypothetical protein n=1 Tax=Motiliproteus sediminis TaxID=1468178 RepID=UPI001AEFB412|nr:hypothetical protein [Motiliproteus sediminis]